MRELQADGELTYKRWKKQLAEQKAHADQKRLWQEQASCPPNIAAVLKHKSICAAQQSQKQKLDAKKQHTKQNQLLAAARRARHASELVVDRDLRAATAPMFGESL